MISPFIALILDYRPAPGQFINEAPEIAPGATRTEVLQAVADQLVGDRTPGLISLGSFGGSLVFAFDHKVANVPGTPDFAIYGNAISNNAEPGVVLVSQDLNGNGLPDDPWYELTGSEESNPETVFNYTITYRRPTSEESRNPHPDWRFVVDADYIPWSDSIGSSGALMKISEHLQSYWPQWLGEDVEELSFSGTLLPPCGISLNDAGNNWKAEPHPWGYADSKPNLQTDRWFDLSNAVDSDRRPVNLAYADFFKVQTATNQFRGWLGEASTEICGAEDLHPDAEASSVPPVGGHVATTFCIRRGTLTIRSDGWEEYILTDASGKTVLSGHLTPGETLIDISSLPKGIYFANCGNIFKFVK